ncbi:MAG: hypothetical protein JWL90_638 [Chthoniobacteraceae bacterium]|nr:hypothetical protein [Chthoniobacteraceae bacterium]
MEISCPSCGKLNQASPCLRCGCDLATLFNLRHAAEQALAEATRFLREGEMADAYGQASRSWELRHSAPAAQLAFLAAIGMADFPGALKWRERRGAFNS